MSHPFVQPAGKGLRERVASLVKEGLHRTAATNILFICGGDSESHLRPKFIEYMKDQMPSYKAFRPEAAQEDFFEHDHVESLNLNAFEELISQLSLGIVLFAESPGSYAEVGLFSALEHARQKTLVVLNAELQGAGSFISFGPAATIGSYSRLGAAIQLDYNNPNFTIIKQRVETRIRTGSAFKAISKENFADLTAQELMALMWFYIDLLQAASFEDLLFCFDSVFDAHVSHSRIKQMLSVMVGAGLIKREGALGLVRIFDRSYEMALPITPKKKQLATLRIEMTDLIDSYADTNYLGVVAHVG